MAQHTWQFSLDNQPYTVDVEIDPFRGIRSVKVGGGAAAPANEGRFDTPALRSLTLAGHSLQVMRSTGSIALLLDGRAIPNTPGQALPSRLQRYEEHRAFWSKLAQLTGLNEAPRADGLFEWRNRLIGTSDNRLVVLDYSVTYQFIRSRVAIFTRFAEDKNVNGLRNKIELDPAVLAITKRLKRSTLEMTIQSAGAAMLLPYDVRKTKPEQVAEDIRTLLNVVKKYTKPIPLTYCDWGKCKSAVHPRELVFYNHSPLLVCSSCMSELEKAGEANQARYNRRTPGFLKAFSGGLAVAALVGVFFGIWKFSLVLAIASFALFFAIVAAMNKLMAKRTEGMLWTAGGLTLLGVLAASVAEATLKLMRSITQSQVEFGMVFRQPDSLRLMGINLAISAAITAATLWFALHQQRQAVRELTHPTIEHSGVQG